MDVLIIKVGESSNLKFPKFFMNYRTNLSQLSTSENNVYNTN